MAAQAMLIAETIAGMKKALSRRDNASDSDGSIHQPTNRGNKLKRKARFVHEGQLDLPNGPRAYRRRIDHAGYPRFIISRNPPRIDEDGDELDEDDVDERADADAAEEDPYADITIENTFAPLTSAANLPTHSSLSLPYYSKTLTEMAQYAGDVTQKEKASLWRTKQLLTKFRGDQTFLPCGLLESDGDGAIFEAYLDGFRNNVKQTEPTTSIQESKLQDQGSRGEQLPAGAEDDEERTDEPGSGAVKAPDTTLDGEPTCADEPEATSKDIVMTDGTNEATEPSEEICGSGASEEKSKRRSTNNGLQSNGMLSKDPDKANISGERESGNGNYVVKDDMDRSLVTEKVETKEETNETVKPSRESGSPAEDGSAEQNSADEDDGTAAPPHRMTTRAQAQQAASTTEGAESSGHRNTLSPSPTADTAPFIHPLFLFAAGAQPDRDFGLPGPEADETRRLLLSTAQKQEEVCRGHEKLQDGLLRADRMRKEVLKWTKAEAHVGEMSDGEDWYDKEEWGLEEDLKKGNEEDEEEGANQGKKTRGRRQ